VRQMVSWGQTTVLVLVGAVFVVLGASNLQGPAVLQIMGGWIPILGGALAVLGALTGGVRFSRGRVTYRNFDSRPYRLSNGHVEIETGPYAPFVYLHELVFHGEDGTVVPLPAASTMSFRAYQGVVHRRARNGSRAGSTASATSRAAPGHRWSPLAHERCPCTPGVLTAITSWSSLRHEAARERDVRGVTARGDGRWR